MVPAAPAITLLVALAPYLSGCLTVESTLKQDGSGSIEMTYPLPPGATPTTEKKRFSSSNVTVESVTPVRANQVQLKATFDDATKLSTAKGFKDVKVTRTREGNEETLLIAITKPTPMKLKDSGQSAAVFKITLPGKVLEANRDATVSGNMVTWQIAFAKYAGEPETDLKVRYAAAAETKPPAGQPAEKN